jgi:outer membrane protein OmpA-like peptidoglycan-associated protein
MRSRVEVVALTRSTVAIAPLRATVGTAASVTGPGLQLRAMPPSERSRVVIAALAPSRIAIEPLGATATAATAALKSELGARDTARGTLISLPGDVLFDFDEYAIRRDARPTLTKLAQLIRQTPEGRVLIEGHTDAKGSDVYNLKLSERRAEAVAEWLGVQEGIDTARFDRRGLGEAQPAAPNTRRDAHDDPEGRQRNRRVEVILTR